VTDESIATAIAAVIAFVLVGSGFLSLTAMLCGHTKTGWIAFGLLVATVVGVVMMSGIEL
jgi:hypothetical protein